MNNEQGSKPPIGVMPRHLWNERRVNDITQAIHRRVVAEQKIPTEWVEEYNELVKKRL